MIGAKHVETDVPEGETIVSHTNLFGVITYANDTFAKISGYESTELIGKPHNILRHPDMPSSLFKNLWSVIKDGGSWSGYVKNRTKQNGYYWVYAQISSLFDKNGVHIGYKSLREAVPREKRNELEEAYVELKERGEGKTKLNIWLDSSLIAKLLEKSGSDICDFEFAIEDVLRVYGANG